LSTFLHDPDFLLREIVEFVDQPIDPAVGGIDLALEVRLLMVRPGDGELPVEGEHLLDQGDHPVVPIPIRRIGEVDEADGELLNKLGEVAEETTSHCRTYLLEKEVQRFTVQQTKDVLMRLSDGGFQRYAISAGECVFTCFVQGKGRSVCNVRNEYLSKKAGAISVDKDRADHALARNTTSAAMEGGRLPPIAESVQVETVLRAGTDCLSLNEARTLTQRYRAGLLKLEIDERTGRLIDVEAVKSSAFAKARQVRDSILNIPDRVAPILAAESDQNRVAEILTAEMKTALDGLSQC
jgi:hypothetical protein